MLNGFLQNLQNKSEHTKVKILYFSAALTVVLVLMAWTSSLGEYKAALDNPAGENEAMKTLKASVADSILETQNLKLETQNKIENKSKEIEVLSNQDEQKLEIGDSKLDTVGIGGSHRFGEAGANPLSEAAESNDLADEEFQKDKQEESKVFKLPVE